MGSEQLAGSQPENASGTEVHREFLPGAHGECLETPSDGIRLHLGCGNKNWAGWVNVDLFGNPDIKADLQVLPFETGYADQAIAIHVIEHFYLWTVPGLLKEWLRVLKPGGKLILELPCMNKVMKYIADCINNGHGMDIRMSWLALWGDPNYESVEMCHKWGYTKLQLIELLQEAGFIDIQILEPVYHVKARDMRIVAHKGDTE